jgi:hypothetical protein
VVAAVLCATGWATTQSPQVLTDEEQSLAQADRALFATGRSFAPLDDNLLDPNISWTDSIGMTRNKSEIVRDFKSGKGLPLEAKSAQGAPTTHIDGQMAVVQENSGKLYLLRVWVKRHSGCNC